MEQSIGKSEHNKKTKYREKQAQHGLEKENDMKLVTNTDNAKSISSSNIIFITIVDIGWEHISQ